MVMSLALLYMKFKVFHSDMIKHEFMHSQRHNVESAAGEQPCASVQERLALSVCLSPLMCYNNIRRTGWLVNRRDSFLTVLKARNRVKVLAASLSREGQLLHIRCLLTVSSCVGKEEI